MSKILNIIVCSLLLASIFSSCQSDSNDLFKNHPQVQTLKQKYEEDPSPATANELLRSLTTVLGSPELDEKKEIPFLEYAYKVAAEQNMNSRKASFLYPLVKEDYSNPENVKRIDELIKIMDKLKKNSVSIVLTEGLIKNYPEYSQENGYSSVLPDTVENLDAYILELGEKIFENPDNSGINRKASLSYVDACEAYALVFPNSPLTPENLFKAAEVAKSLRTFPKSLGLYDWIIEKYPDYEKTATSLFLKGFIIENNLGNEEKARQVYESFLERYPSHELADDVQFLLENLGKTDEEILQMIEERRKQNEQATESE